MSTKLSPQTPQRRQAQTDAYTHTRAQEAHTHKHKHAYTYVRMVTVQELAVFGEA